MASTYLNRSAVTGNRRTFTISAWVKRSELGTEQQIYSSRSSASNVLGLYFQGSNDTLLVTDYQSGGTMSFTTSAVYRDVSAWYHIVLEVDTTQATDTNRVKLYVNGEQATFSASSYPTLNRDLYINVSGSNHYIGTEQSGRYFNGSMTHIHFIDGTAYDASAFGETNAASGIWTPLASPSVTYGNNGFFLKFASSGALGTDSSGNSNTFTVNGSGTQTQDAPSNVFATLNSLIVSGSPTYANGNTTVATIGDNDSVVSTFGVSNMKYYYEAKLLQTYDGSGGGINVGGLREEQFNASGFNSGSFSGFSNAYTKFYGNGGDGRFKEGGGTVVTSGLTRAVAGDIVMIAIDPANNRVYAGVNGIWLNSSDPVAGTGYIGGTQATGTGNWFAFISSDLDKGNCNANFGNGFFGTTAVASGNADGAGYGIFEYAPPTGYYSLCTKNINTYG